MQVSPEVGRALFDDYVAKLKEKAAAHAGEEGDARNGGRSSGEEEGAGGRERSSHRSKSKKSKSSKK